MDAVIIPKAKRPASNPVPGLSGCPGVNLRAGGNVEIDARRYTPEQARLLELRASGKPVRLRFQPAGQAASPSSEDLQLINERHSSVELTEDDIIVFQDYAVSDRVANKPIRFTEAALERLAESYTSGRTVLFHHNDEYPVGTTFAAEVAEETVRGVEAKWLKTRWYAVTKNASEQRLQDIQDAQTGVMRYASVGIFGGQWEHVETDAEDGEHSVRYFLIDDNPGAPRTERLDGREMSRVYLGAMEGAGDSSFSSTTNN